MQGCSARRQPRAPPALACFFAFASAIVPSRPDRRINRPQVAGKAHGVIGLSRLRGGAGLGMCAQSPRVRGFPADGKLSVDRRTSPETSDRRRWHSWAGKGSSTGARRTSRCRPDRDHQSPAPDAPTRVAALVEKDADPDLAGDHSSGGMVFFKARMTSRPKRSFSPERVIPGGRVAADSPPPLAALNGHIEGHRQIELGRRLERRLRLVLGLRLALGLLLCLARLCLAALGRGLGASFGQYLCRRRRLRFLRIERRQRGRLLRLWLGLGLALGLRRQLRLRLRLRLRLLGAGAAAGRQASAEVVHWDRSSVRSWRAARLRRRVPRRSRRRFRWHRQSVRICERAMPTRSATCTTAAARSDSQKSGCRCGPAPARTASAHARGPKSATFAQRSFRLSLDLRPPIDVSVVTIAARKGGSRASSIVFRDAYVDKSTARVHNPPPADCCRRRHRGSRAAVA